MSFPALDALSRGHWFDAVYTVSMPVALLVASFVWKKKFVINSTDSSKRRQQFLTAFVCFFAVAYFFQSQKSQRIDATKIDGISEPGSYVNYNFGFRVQYSDDWSDVTSKMRTQAAVKSAGNASQDWVLLTIAKTSEETPTKYASLAFMVESLPKFKTITSGADYLTKLLLTLKNRPDGPREITKGPSSKIAGLVFDRVSFKRPWGDTEAGMTYWAAIKGDYALVITGSYLSDDGLQAIDMVMTQISEVSDSDRTMNTAANHDEAVRRF
ncbi:MAG: hypothetical protein NT013_09810 [Planctomycetia bacterium]|nr:hypothetical protein [Planctomycetia bacterium]